MRTIPFADWMTRSGLTYRQGQSIRALIDVNAGLIQAAGPVSSSFDDLLQGLEAKIGPIDDSELELVEIESAGLD
jgi:hypothetical protein